MLQLKNICKDYAVGSELTVHALKNVSLNFRDSEFVSILGPSGCGKTTLLNVIGGLDRYDGGDLVINGKSTKGFCDADWDTYRNHSIGFVFQSYNLIPHMSILDNVALALSIAGVSKGERILRAKEALAKVGLSTQLKKRPNQLSGGQMQRVAIARAIVNNPDIILADEPTGALDTETGVQVMELLKEIAKDRLVIMVTHNQQLAYEYSTRIVQLLDGELTSDSNPYTATDVIDGAKQLVFDSERQATDQSTGETTPKKKKRSGMSLWTAFSISLRSLWTKKGRTFLTSFAGSIGIFGIALVLAISGGMGDYVAYMQTEAVGDSAVTIGESAYSISRILTVMEDAGGIGQTAYPDMDGVIPYQRQSFSTTSTLSTDFINYVQDIDQKWIKAMNFTYSVNMHVLQYNEATQKYVARNSWANVAQQMIDEDQLIEDNYDVLYHDGSSETGYPKQITEVSLVVDKFNRISPSTLSAIGISYTNPDGSYRQVPYTEIVGREYTIVLNDGWYVQNGDRFSEISSSQYGEINPENTLNVKIVSIMRVKNNESTLWLSSGLAYLPELSEYLVENAKNSQVGQAQLAATDHNVRTGGAFSIPAYGTDEEKAAYVETQYINALKGLGAYTIPTSIKIYPKDIDSKQNITSYLESWNWSHPDDEVAYLDITGLALNLMSTFIDVVTYVLIAFSAVALIVSTVMISVITYTSVIERVKEIGVLRSIGARKRDISGIFNAETAIIGLFAGVMGVIFALALGALINAAINALFGVSGIAKLTVPIVASMFALSIGLTLLAGLIPARIAANKDPVTCLRTE